MRIAAASGALLLVLMWTAVLPPENNPFMDDHLIYAILLVGLALAKAGDTLGLGRWWSRPGWSALPDPQVAERDEKPERRGAPAGRPSFARPDRLTGDTCSPATHAHRKTRVPLSRAPGPA